MNGRERARTERLGVYNKPRDIIGSEPKRATMIEMVATTSGERIVKILGVAAFLADVVLIFVTPKAFGK